MLVSVQGPKNLEKESSRPGRVQKGDGLSGPLWRKRFLTLDGSEG